jgi:dihydrolipoamide dehydrogenase
MESFDIVVIGSGPGGYVAAIRAAQLGFKTAIIEKYATLGGTCLNVGCIPSKALLDSSEHFYNAKHKFEAHGISIGKMTVDMATMVKRKNDVVSQTCAGVEYLMKKNKITRYLGHGSFVDAHTISIKQDTTETQISAKYTIIATGSKPIVPANFNYDKKRIITSTEALNIVEIPKKMVVVGAGVIGLELSSVYARLGTQVTIIEYADKILPTMDSDCAKELQKSLKLMGIEFLLGHAVASVTAKSKSVNVTFAPKNGGESKQLEADYCLVAIGRRAYTDGLGLEKAGVLADEKGKIKVDGHLKTNIDHIYAIGDVIDGPMLAHKASEDGVFVAETIAGQHPHLDYNLIPGVVYTWPEMSSVGQTEDELKAQGIPYKVGKFPMKALGRARASMDTEGLVKILAHKETDEILGTHIFGARAADLIMEAVSLMTFRASAEDAAIICHPHPTYTEAIKEAALDATGSRPIHF